MVSSFALAPLIIIYQGRKLLIIDYMLLFVYFSINIKILNRM